jgi:hypothetical protein
MAKGIIVDGMEFPEGVRELEANLWMYSQGEVKGDGSVVEPEDRFRYLKRAIDLAFNCEGSIRKVVWNEWTDRILREMIGGWDKKRFLGIAGCSSSGKSDGVALYGLMEYWSRPTETFFLVMSTTKLSARMRVWKSITQMWGQAKRMGCPGKLIDSDGYIKGIDKVGDLSRNSGIVLMAAGKADAEAACKELLGIKNPNVVIGADEFNELGDGILKTAYENMTSNDRLNFAGMANPDKLSDPFGELCEPLVGWKAITEEDEEWRTKYGKCIRLNAEKSPRITEPNGEEFYWQPDQEYCDRIAANRGGKKSRGYYRFVKAFWCPDGSPNSIYSEAEFLSSGALNQEEPIWDANPTILTSLDPSFSRDGDRSQSTYGKLGEVNGRSHLHICMGKTIEDDVRRKDVALTHQIVRGWKKLSEEWGVKPLHAIFDNTGAGTPFGHVVDMEWSPVVQRVNFQGKASDRTVVFRNEDCAFFNKNSEIWIQPKEFIRGGQITGITNDIMSELIEREYHGKESRTVRVESKEDAKRRLKRSPDHADSFLMLVEKAVSMGYFRSEEQKKVSKMSNNGWHKARMEKGLVTTCGRRFRG